MKRLFTQLGASLIMLFTLSVNAHAQACPGGFWGNGQCIGACDSPLVNPNVRLAFYAWSCLGNTRLICTDGGAYCYPEYTAYDMVYGAYCGVITDYGAGECTFPYLGFNQFPPKREDELKPDFPHSAFRLAINVRRPIEFKPRPVRSVVLHKSRFWWKHENTHHL